MTAPAAAPAPAPIAPLAPRASPHPAADHLAFAAVLDSLPGGGAKAGAPTAETSPHPSDESREEGSPSGQAAGHSPFSDGTLLASLPFALQAGLTMPKDPEAAPNAPSLAAAATKGPRPEDGGTSIAASGETAPVGRLIGERAFHFGVTASPRASAGRVFTIDEPFAPAGASGGRLASEPKLSAESAAGADFAQAEAMPATASTEAAPSTENAAASIGSHAETFATHRASPARAVAQDAARSQRKHEVPAPAPVAKAASSAAAAARAPAETTGKAVGGRPPDPTTSAAAGAGPSDPFGAFPPASFTAGPSPDSGASTPSAADLAPRASAIATSPASAAPPVREIDVDLSPGGLEDVSMTMRLAGEKLSVVIRAGSSQTLGSIEGARDAIADRMAAIGQPLDSLIVKQTGVNADGNTNGNMGSADDGSAGGDWRSAQDAGERGGANDASSSRRGAGRDRGF
jgi:hypothetical protein